MVAPVGRLGAHDGLSPPSSAARTAVGLSRASRSILPVPRHVAAACHAPAPLPGANRARAFALAPSAYTARMAGAHCDDAAAFGFDFRSFFAPKFIVTRFSLLSAARLPRAACSHVAGRTAPLNSSAISRRRGG